LTVKILTYKFNLSNVLFVFCLNERGFRLSIKKLIKKQVEMFRLSKINILQFYCKYWNLRRKFDESLCKEVNHNLSFRKINRTNHQCATYNYASHGLYDKYFRCWCESRNCMNQGFLTKNIVKLLNILKSVMKKLKKI
jgi:hypothetical protein